MAARKWTAEQRAKQSALIHSWKPWQQSTGAKTPEGKKISSKNAVNYSIRELLRESTRVNKELLYFIRGSGIAPRFDLEFTDKLFDNIQTASNESMQELKKVGIDKKQHKNTTASVKHSCKV